MTHNHEKYRVTCGTCHNSWCEHCDPAPSALCPWCHGRGHSTASLCDCGHLESPHSDFTRGYGTDDQGKTHCYDCCARDELLQIEKTGRVFAYLTKDPDTGHLAITNWPGPVLSSSVLILSQNTDNFGGERTYLRFLIDDQVYSGFGLGVGMYLRAKLTQLTDLYA